VELGRDTKLIAAAEVGAAPLPRLLQAYEAHWLWFAVWGDTFINNAEWNSVSTLNEVSSQIQSFTRVRGNTNERQIYNSDYVLTLDEIQGWRG